MAFSTTFEDGTTQGWVAAADATIANSVAQAHSGARSLEVTATGADTANASTVVQASAVPGPFTVSGWLRTADPAYTEGYLQAFFLDAGFGFLGASFIGPVPTVVGTWTLVGPLTGTAPAGTASVVLAALASSATLSLVGGEVAYWDDFAFTQAAAGGWIVGAVGFGSPVPVSATGTVVVFGHEYELVGLSYLSTWAAFFDGLAARATNGGSGILVVGAGKYVAPPFDDEVTAFWSALTPLLSSAVTYVNGDTAVGSVALGSYALVVAVTNGDEVFGGLDNGTSGWSDELSALNARQADVAAFVNGGGVLLAGDPYGSDPAPWAYAFAGGLSATTVGAVSGITITLAGASFLFTSPAMEDFWHQLITAVPAGFIALVTRTSDSAVLAIGSSSAVL